MSGFARFIRLQKTRESTFLEIKVEYRSQLPVQSRTKSGRSASGQGQGVSALAGLQALVEKRREPLELLNPGNRRISCRQMHMQLHGEMRCQHHTRLLGYYCPFQIRHDTAHPLRIGHEDVGTLPNELSMLRDK